jgi:holo-[acyl-carrier protein] synthase
MIPLIKGSGIDIIEIQRIRTLIEEKGQVALERLFTEREVEYCASKRDPYPSYAARFAAKEAFLKALGTGLRGLKWAEIEILPDESGKPIMYLKGSAALKLHEIGAVKVNLSISHCREYAVAQVILI